MWMDKLAAAAAVTVGLTLAASCAHAQEYPLTSERPKPLTATLVGVCERRERVLMVAVFTFSNGKTLVVDGKHMQGFEDVAAIVRYAATATTPVNEYAQMCGDAST